MPAEVRLPQEGMSMTEGEIVAWCKAVGDPVAKGEVIAEIESEKSTFPLEAPADGVLAAIEVPAGQRVAVRTVVALIATPGEEVAPAPAAPPDPAPAPDPPPTVPRRADAADPRPRRPTPAQVTPAARRLARQHDVDLASVRATGPNGRVLPEDVQRVIDGSDDGTAPTGGEVVPLDGVRGVIARRMVTSLRTMAQMTLVSECDVTELVALRRERAAVVPASYTHLIVRAVALSLRDHPRLNATSDEDAIHVADEIAIGLAVQHDDRLVVPVLRKADRLDLAGIVAESTRLVDAVRSGRATPDVYEGGTFTVSNLGAYGIDAFTPIVNPPQVAILGVGRIVERAVRTDDGLAWRQILTLSLTVDHRVVDGAPAAELLATVAARLRDPAPLFEAP